MLVEGRTPRQALPSDESQYSQRRDQFEQYVFAPMNLNKASSDGFMTIPAEDAKNASSGLQEYGPEALRQMNGA